MVRILVWCLVLAVVRGAPKHRPKFPKGEDYEVPLLRKVACSSENERRRSEIIEKSKCGEPKDVFVYLEPRAAHEQVNPGAVWVKRCVGLCDYDTYGSKCVPIETRTIHIPIRIYNVKMNKETCATYPVEEHVACGCCAGGAGGCAAPKVFDHLESEYEVESI